MKSITIEAETRNESGKKSSDTLRKSGSIPCNIYGGSENISFSAPVKSFKTLVFTPEFLMANIKINGREINAIVKEIQSHPVTDEIQHIDFLELIPQKEVIVDLPIKLIGTPKGAREGGKLTQKMRKIKVKTLPENLMEFLEINIEHLELGKTIRVGDVKRDGLELMVSDNMPIASVMVARAVKEEVATVVAAAAPAAGAAPAAAGAPATVAKAPAAAKPAEKKGK